MEIPCTHWSRGDMVNGGVCAIGSEDPEKRKQGFPRTRPGFSECDRCPHYVGPKRLGQIIEKAVKPIAIALGLDCLDAKKQLKPESDCARRAAQANKAARVVGDLVDKVVGS
jgi:hypothetical protein